MHLSEIFREACMSLVPAKAAHRFFLKKDLSSVKVDVNKRFVSPEM